tara:strand:- start:2 stop:253 length:252 start_codon:yes stop_codon:yes gene_type:complete
MKKDISLVVENLTDEQILKEFTKRFECDGAILLYMEDQKEFGFGRWASSDGRKWVNEVFSTIKNSPLPKIRNKRKSNLKKLTL